MQQNPYPLFYKLLANNLVALVTNNFVWFAVTFWAIIETKSVIVASFIAGIFAVTNMFGAVFFGGIVDHQRKHFAMWLSSLISLAAFIIGTALYYLDGLNNEVTAASPLLWLFIITLMIGAVAGNLRTIALATTVTMLFTSQDRDKANGLVGTMQGVAFALTSIFSGVVIGFFGMGPALLIAVVFTLGALIHVFSIDLIESTPTVLDQAKRLDVLGTIAVVMAIPGLLALIFFNTVNNFLGGVFMALMDIYGLSLMSVESWGLMWGALSLVMITGGMMVAKYGVGKKPLRTIMLTNVIAWSTCLFFPIQASILLLALGMAIWMITVPFTEAAEQTVIQNIVPAERQGRVFGLAQSIESAASPITAFIIGPITASIFIPFMTTGAGVELIGSWFGTGDSRGIALVFIASGMIGLIVTLVAWASRSYQRLSRHYDAAVASPQS